MLRARRDKPHAISQSTNRDPCIHEFSIFTDFTFPSDKPRIRVSPLQAIHSLDGEPTGTTWHEAMCRRKAIARTPTVASLHREETCNRHAKERFSGPTATDQCSTRFWTFVSWHCDGGGVRQLGKPLRRGHPSLFERAARCMLPGRRSWTPRRALQYFVDSGMMGRFHVRRGSGGHGWVRRRGMMQIEWWSCARTSRRHIASKLAQVVVYSHALRSPVRSLRTQVSSRWPLDRLCVCGQRTKRSR
jgi:hypothetical protein